ncbi:MAG: DUF1538 family protein, partial [Monoglobales bacterium]
MPYNNTIVDKMKESIYSVLPIVLIVAVLCIFIFPVSNGLMLSFIIGSVMIILGMGLFAIGADISMTQIGMHMGSKMTMSKNLWLIVILSFILGVVITVAEPDLQVLATNAPNIDKSVLIIAVSIGVGLFLVVSMLRSFFAIPLRWIFIVFYAV